jgi:hypothetical protein
MFWLTVSTRLRQRKNELAEQNGPALGLRAGEVLAAHQRCWPHRQDAERTTAMSPRARIKDLFWTIIGWMILISLRRSAAMVLLTREISENDQPARRWLVPDFRRFMSQVAAMANDLRPIAELDALPRVGNRLMVEMAIFTSAAYRVFLDRGVPSDSARTLVADIGWDYYAALLRLTSLPFRLTTRDPGKRLQRTIQLLLRFPFSAPGTPGYAVDARTEGPDILTHFTHCPPQSFVRTLIARQSDRADLDAFRQSWRRYDWPGADLIAADGKRSHYVRRRTLSDGDAVCDMCWSARALGQADDKQKQRGIGPEPKKEQPRPAGGGGHAH